MYMDSLNSQWTYKYSQNLKQNIGYNKETGWVQCEDGTKYSPQENEILKMTGKPVPLEVHLIKKVFNGTLVLLS